MLIIKKSPLTGITRAKELNVTMEQINRWENGENIQYVMPSLSEDEREFIMTGITREEWQELFKKDIE